jgi:hypothetical protein
MLVGTLHRLKSTIFLLNVELHYLLLRPTKIDFTTRIPGFSTGFSNQKISQSDGGLEKHFGFLGQVDFNKSSMTRMVFFTNLKVVFLTNPKVVLLIKFFD